MTLWAIRPAPRCQIKSSYPSSFLGDRVLLTCAPDMFNIFEMGKSDPCGDLVCREEIVELLPISDILLSDGGRMAFI